MTSPIIVALDFPDEGKALSLVDRLEPELCRLKVGKEMFTRLGPEFVERLMDRGFDVFLDLKFHDIPNTVARACAAAADLGVWMVNVHASGGRHMMAAAREALEPFSNRPLLIAVTILTSLDETELTDVGFSGTPEENVARLAALARDEGLDGVVCSPLEVTGLRAQLGENFLLVTPGVRPAGSDLGDQKRVMTPSDAMAAGSSYLVIGRPVTGAEVPLVALQEINASLAG